MKHTLHICAILCTGIILTSTFLSSCGSSDDSAVTTNRVAVSEPDYSYTEENFAYEDGSYFCFRYDDEGNVRQVSYYDSEDAEESLATADYDTAGNKTHEGQMAGDSVYSRDYSYDADGNLTHILVYMDGGLAEEQIREFDDQGNLSSDCEKYYSDGELLTEYTVTYEYNAEGNITLQGFDYSDYETESNSYFYSEERTYDDLTCNITRKDADGNVTATGIEEYGDFTDAYSAGADDGSLLLYELYSGDGSLLERTENQFDDLHRCVARTQEYHGESAKYYDVNDVVDTSEFTYDSQNNVLKRIYYRNDVLMYEFNCTYDDESRLITSTDSNYYEDEKGELQQTDFVTTVEYLDHDLVLTTSKGDGFTSITKSISDWLSYNYDVY